MRKSTRDFRTRSVFPVRLPRLRHAMPHTHPFHAFYFSISSTGTQFAGERAHEPRPGQFFSLPAGVPHVCTVWKSASPVEAVVLYMHEGVFSEKMYGDADTCRVLQYLLREGREGRHEISIRAETAERLKPLLQRLCGENEDRPGYRSGLKAGMQALFLTLMRDPDLSGAFSPEPVAPRERFERLLRYLETHFAEKQTVEAAARLCGLSRSHFHALFREATGTTLVTHLTRLRVEAAKRLLTETALPITEVAPAAGFEQLAHFYRCFQQETGKPPGRWRREAASGAS